jgi:hypothetical protein
MYRLAASLAIVSSVMLVWLSLGVGIIGKDGDPANRMYLGVLAVGLVGTVLARGRSSGMALTMYAMAGAQGIVTTVALATGLGRPWSEPPEILALNAIFIALFVSAGWLFGRASLARSEGNDA